MIRVVDLHKRFGPTHAVVGVDFAIERGSVVGFLGPNGAGKTTTIRVLTGFHPASSGRAEVAGFDVATQSLAARRAIGYLPQEVPIYPDMRVVEYLRYRAALKGVPARRRGAAVAAAVEKAGIGEVARRLCGQVSHGYRQRVGLADALLASPPVLILDEPTSGLDPNQRRRIKQVVRDLAGEHTILFSSHILAEVQDVCSRILVIHRGRLRADGTPGELVGRTVRRTLRVWADASAAALRDALVDWPTLACATMTEPPEGGARLAALIEPGDDPGRALGARLLHRGIAVRELTIEQPTLEEYFYRITEGGDAAAGSGSDDDPEAGPVTGRNS